MHRPLVALFNSTLVLLICWVLPLHAQLSSPLMQPSLSRPLADLPVLIGQDLDARESPQELPRLASKNSLASPALSSPPGPLTSTEDPNPAEPSEPPLPPSAPLPLQSFPGMSYLETHGGFPSDVNGDVGPAHYVQAVNSAISVYSKTGGVRLAGPTPINSLWSGAGGDCETYNDGLPIVLYDELADRWLVSQVAVSSTAYKLCVAISQSSDPLGGYYRYQFDAPAYPDAPKYGVWPSDSANAYFVSTNEPGAVGVYALDREKMLTGQASSYIRFTANTNMLLPADHDGRLPPPGDTASGWFYTFVDGGTSGGVDRIELYAFTPNFTTPAASSFVLAHSIPISPFNYTICGPFVLGCIPQPDTTRKLDAVSEWPMWRFSYRNMGDRQVMVGNFAVETTNATGGGSGIRWFEIENANGTGWHLAQEGTYAPDGDYRFLGSVAMDRKGDLAAVYNVASATTYPSWRYAVRRKGDRAGLLGQELPLVNGGNAQTLTSRWGDYASVSVDPADGCTFWATGQTLGIGGFWETQIVAFRIPGCIPPPPGILMLLLDEESDTP